MNGGFMKVVWAPSQEKFSITFKIERAALLGSEISNAKNVQQKPAWHWSEMYLYIHL